MQVPTPSRKSPPLLKLCIQGAALAAVLAASAIQAHAQGCVAIKQMGDNSSPIEDSDLLDTTAPDKWDYTLSYEHFRSDKDYTGPKYNGQRQTLGNSVINVVNQFDSSFTYDFNSLYSVSVDIPYFEATRSQLDYAKARYVLRSDGLGDIRIAADRWLIDPTKKPIGDIQVGLGVSVPTGQDDVKGWVPTASGPVLENDDQSIQPGEGGWGFIFQGQAYLYVTQSKATSLYLTGFYMATPQDANNARTTRSIATDVGYDSIYDQYQLRWGVNQVLAHFKGGVLSGSLGGRFEGVPSLDLIGASDGFRRPGYVLSVEPGLSYALPHDSFSISVPIAWYRNRTQSYPEMVHGGHGDAFFADYLIIASYSHKW